MRPRLFSSCLLSPGQLAPSQQDMRVVGAFNPGAVATEQGVVLLIRVAEAPWQNRPGFVGLPRWDLETGKIVIDWLAEQELIVEDARVVKVRETGLCGSLPPPICGYFAAPTVASSHPASSKSSGP
ncbi:MAG: hypothetical protein EBS30_09910, partial [Planctomycetes bacterium]|nr:hypothetical protein [Planctomycetota bacterium]